MNRFVLRTNVVQFVSVRERSGGETIELFQPKGVDSDGNEYVYDKSLLCRSTHDVALPNETTASLAAIKAFLIGPAGGCRYKFTWEDEEDVGHTVRYAAGSFRSTPIGPGRFRVELQLIEEISWEALAAPASFEDALAAKTGVMPVWILRVKINGTDYFLSDCAFSIAPTAIVSTPGWPAGVAVTTFPLVKSWGEIQEQLSGNLNEIRISDFSCEVISDPFTTLPAFHELVEAYPIEKDAAELYQWYIWLDPATDPPRLRFRGYCKEPGISQGETSVSLSIQDESLKMQNFSVGTLIDATTYPTADPSAIGKVEPIVIGTPGSKAPLLLVANGAGGAVFMAAGRPLSSLPNVYIRNNGTDTNINTQCFRYTGQTGNVHPDYPGKSVVYLTPAQVTAVLALGGISLTDPEHSHDTGNYVVNQTGTATDWSDSGGTTFPVTVAVNFTPIVGTFVAQTVDIEINYNAYNPTIVIGGVSAPSGVRTWSPGAGNTFYVVVTPGSGGRVYSVSIVVKKRDYTYIPGTAPAATGMTLSGNTGPASIGACQLLADVVGVNTAPGDVVTEILGLYDESITLDVAGAFPTGYTLNGVITAQINILQLLHTLAFQCRAFFHLALGVARLIVRPDTLTPTATIPAVAVGSDGRKMITSKKTVFSDILNKIEVRYNRDWTKSGIGDDAYQSLAKGSGTGIFGDPAYIYQLSVDDYGQSEQPDLFRFDFVTDADMAESVRAFYLAYYSQPHWQRTIQEFLDRAALLFGDIVALGFKGDEAGVVVSAGLSPGSKDAIDTVKLIIETPMSMLHYVDDDYVATDYIEP